MCMNNHGYYSLGIWSLADVLTAIKEVTKPYQPGIQLKIDSSQLDTIERSHPRDIDRQKTEVVKYWLCNSSDASWTTLANAVKRMGGHARLAERLKNKEIKSEEEKQNTSVIKVERKRGHARSVDMMERNKNKKKKRRASEDILMYSHEDSLDTTLACLKVLAQLIDFLLLFQSS